MITSKRTYHYNSLYRLLKATGRELAGLNAPTANHLGSASLELNEAAEIISYQEYHPFGSTSYELHTNDSEVSLKRYQYVGKERDGESGLYYYGARCYADWLCRFVSVDPLKDDYPYYTTYQYAGNKPISYIDLDGLEEANLQEEELKTEPKQIVSGISHVDDFKPPIGSIDTRWGIKAGDYTLYGVTYYNNEGEVAGYYWIARLEDGEGKYQDDYIIGVEAVAEFIENAEEYSYLANVIDWAIALGGKRGGTKGQNLFEAWKSTWSIENILTGATIAGGGFVPLRPRPPMPRVKAFPRARVSQNRPIAKINIKRHSLDSDALASGTTKATTLAPKEILNSDMAAYNLGKFKLTSNGDVLINGRLYGLKNEGKTLFPRSGGASEFIDISPGQLKAIQLLKKVPSDRLQVAAQSAGISPFDLEFARMFIKIY